MAHRRSRRVQRPSPAVWLAFAAAAAVAFAAGVWVGNRRAAPVEEPAAEALAERETQAPPARPAPPESPAVPPPSVPRMPAPAEPESPVGAIEASARLAPGGTARIALVIDDLGRSLDELTALGELGIPLTYSVLPFETRTAEVVEQLRRQQSEILCHLPMEPGGGANPGPGALTRQMNKRELKKATLAALEQVPGAVGVNNHMGSSLSAEERSMGPILDVLVQEDLFFLDSRTSADSVGYRMALERGLPSAERRVFLDPDPDPDAIRVQFDRLLAMARRDGSAIAIGHPRDSTLEVLAEQVALAQELGYEFVPVSYLLDRTDVVPQ